MYYFPENLSNFRRCSAVWHVRNEPLPNGVADWRLVDGKIEGNVYFVDTSIPRTVRSDGTPLKCGARWLENYAVKFGCVAHINWSTRFVRLSTEWEQINTRWFGMRTLWQQRTPKNTSESTMYRRQRRRRRRTGRTRVSRENATQNVLKNDSYLFTIEFHSLFEANR